MVLGPTIFGVTARKPGTAVLKRFTSVQPGRLQSTNTVDIEHQPPAIFQIVCITGPIVASMLLQTFTHRVLQYRMNLPASAPKAPVSTEVCEDKSSTIKGRPLRRTGSTWPRRPNTNPLHDVILPPGDCSNILPAKLKCRHRGNREAVAEGDQTGIMSFRHYYLSISKGCTSNARSVLLTERPPKRLISSVRELGVPHTVTRARQRICLFYAVSSA